MANMKREGDFEGGMGGGGGGKRSRGGFEMRVMIPSKVDDIFFFMKSF